MIPYIVVCFLYNDPIKLLLGINGYNFGLKLFAEQLLGVNCAHLWYLPCLFVIMTICYQLFTWAGKTVWKHGFIIILFALSNYRNGMFPILLQLQNTTYYLLYFYTGYMVNFIIINFHQHLYVLKKPLWLSLIIVSIFSVGYIIKCKTSIGYEMFLSVIIICLLFALVPNFNNGFMDEISRRSYGIYLFHSPLIYLTATYCPNINPWGMLLVNFICFGMVAYFITILLSKSKLKLLIGENR